MGSSISGKGSEEDGMSVSNWGRCLDMILQAEMGSGSPLEGTILDNIKISFKRQ